MGVYDREFSSAPLECKRDNIINAVGPVARSNDFTLCPATRGVHAELLNYLCHS